MHLTRYIGRPTSVSEPAIQHSATNGQRKKNSPCQRPVQTSTTSQNTIQHCLVKQCWTRWPNESNNKKAIKKKFKLQTIWILGPTFAQICVRESNSVLQAIQTNQSLFIKLGNKRHVLGCLTECLTEIKFRKTLSNIVKHGGQTSKTRFYKTMWDVLRGCFTLDRPLICPLL